MLKNSRLKQRLKQSKRKLASRKIKKLKSSKKPTKQSKRKLGSRKIRKQSKKSRRKSRISFGMKRRKLTNFKFPIITIKIENHKYNFMPQDFYKVNHNNGRYNFVIIYKISSIDENLVEEISYIPYYISDGNTNGLRANLLFPFICFNSRDESDLCPYIQGPYLGINGLLKLSLENISTLLDTNVLSYWVNKDVQNKIDKLYTGQIKTDYQKMLNHMIETNKRVGLPSVLPRLKNFLDFIILISSEEVSKFDMNQKDDIFQKYRPVFAPTTSNIEELNKYDMTYIENTSRSIRDNCEDNYRSTLMYIFRAEQNNIQYLLGDDFNLEYVHKTYSSISTLDFNNLFLINYEKHTEIPHKNENSCTYAKISFNLNIDMVNHVNSKYVNNPNRLLLNYLTILNAHNIENIKTIKNRLYNDEAYCRNIVPSVLARWKHNSEK